VLVDEASSTLFPIAKDVKIQVEFNPQAVSEYRLIGYETRLLNREDFNNDKVDAGEIGAGHSVTALYEITPANSTAKLVDPLRYGKAEPSAGGGEYAFVKLRYKLPNEETSKLITQPVSAANEAASKEATFAAAVAAFGQLLRGGQYTKSFTYDDVITLALSAKGDDPFGYRAEFINLVRTAKTAQGLEPLNP
jgi:Ca-activated chloride channel family protein